MMMEAMAEVMKNFVAIVQALIPTMKMVGVITNTAEPLKVVIAKNLHGSHKICGRSTDCPFFN